MTENNSEPESIVPSTRGAADLSAPADFADRAKLPFPVVGIGASAGGIQALTELLQATPPDSGMAYVVVLHLSPDHQSLVAEILGRHTDMPVHQIQQGMGVEAQSRLRDPTGTYPDAGRWHTESRRVGREARLSASGR